MDINSVQGIGEFTDIQTRPASTEITFKDRKTAEKFFNSVLLANKELPGLDTPVEVNWAGVNGASGSMPTTPSVFMGGSKASNGGANEQTRGDQGAVSANGEDDDGGNDHRGAREEGEVEGDAGGSGDKDVHILLDRPTNGDHHHHHRQKDREQREMDYEVADEEDQWGY